MCVCIVCLVFVPCLLLVCLLVCLLSVVLLNLKEKTYKIKSLISLQVTVVAFLLQLLFVVAFLMVVFVGCCSDFLSCIGDIVFAAKYLHQLRLVVVNVALHNIHAGTQQTLKRLNIQEC